MFIFWIKSAAVAATPPIIWKIVAVAATDYELLYQHDR